MSRKCSICNHPKRDEIDKRLLRGDTRARIAQEFAVSAFALDRHFKNHLVRAIAPRAHPLAQVSPETDVPEILRADALVEELHRIRTKTHELLEKASNAGSTHAFGSPAQYLREMREQLRLLAELEGRLREDREMQVNILINPEWVQLRTLILEALEPYPEAKEAVANALAALARACDRSAIRT